MTVVCGTDLTLRAEPGATAAAALCSRLSGGTLVLVHVAEKGGPELAARARLSELAGRLELRFGIRVQAGVEHGNPAEVLIAEAEKGGGLLVVSCPGHGKTPLFKVGGVAERIAEQARVPTLVVRDSTAFEEWAAWRRALEVVIGLAGSPGDRGAIDWISTLRRAGPCDVSAVTVYDPSQAREKYGLPRTTGSVLEPDPRVERLIVADMERAIGDLQGSGRFACHAMAGAGRAGDHLLEFASAKDADLLVVGARRSGFLARFSSVPCVALHWRRTSIACIPAVAQT